MHPISAYCWTRRRNVTQPVLRPVPSAQVLIGNRPWHIPFLFLSVQLWFQWQLPRLLVQHQTPEVFFRIADELLKGPELCKGVCDLLLLMAECRLVKCLEWSKMTTKSPNPFHFPLTSSSSTGMSLTCMQVQPYNFNKILNSHCS